MAVIISTSIGLQMKTASTEAVCAFKVFLECSRLAKFYFWLRACWEVFSYAINVYILPVPYIVRRGKIRMSCEVFSYAMNGHILPITLT